MVSIPQIQNLVQPNPKTNAPQLRWPTVDYAQSAIHNGHLFDREVAPTQEQARDRYYLGKTNRFSVKSQLFLQAAFTCNNIAILDPFFDFDCQNNLTQLLSLHPGPLRIRILTDVVSGEKNAIKKNCANFSCDKPLRNVEVKDTVGTDISYLHDRFAVTDDELWHFGHTVGGFGAQLTAYSKGWFEQTSPFLNLFEVLWKSANDC